MTQRKANTAGFPTTNPELLPENIEKRSLPEPILLAESEHPLYFIRIHYLRMQGVPKGLMNGFFMRDGKFYSLFFTMAVTIALQSAVVFSVNLADAVMLSRYTETALAGVALMNQIQFLLQMLVFGIGEGALIFASRSWGERKIEPIRKIANIALKFSLFFAILLGGLMLILPETILGLLAKDEPIVAEGARYARIIVWSYPVFAISQILMILLRSVETVKISFYLSVVTFFTNVSLNYLLIFGNCGFPELGCRGAAVATLSARILELILIVAYLRFIDRKIHLRLPHLLKKVDPLLLTDYIRTGSPVFLSGTIWGIAMAIQTGILGHLGASAIAANSVATTVFQIITVFVFASASAAAVMIGKTIGERRMDLIHPYVHTFQVLFLGIGICSGLFLFFLKDPMILLFTELSPDSAALALQFMTVLSVTTVGTAYQMPVLTGIVRAGGETDFVLKNDLIFMWLLVLPSSALAAFVFHLSPMVVFLCLKSDQVLKCAVAAVKLNRYTWIRKISREET